MKNLIKWKRVLFQKSGRDKNIIHGFVLIAIFIGVLGLVITPVGATPITFTGSSGDLSASVTFDTSGTDLIVTLTNTSTADVLVPADVLTAVFFNIDGDPSLTPISAKICATCTVFFGGTDPGGVVGGEWAYNPDLSSGSLPGVNQGISSVGLGLFGPGDRFPGNNLQGPNSPNGLQYGITSAGDGPTTGNTPVTGSNALIQNQVIFTLSGLPIDFDPSTSISNVFFQYGTSLTEPRIPGEPQIPIPEPTSLLLLGSGLVGFGLWGKKKFRARK